MPGVALTTRRRLSRSAAVLGRLRFVWLVVFGAPSVSSWWGPIYTPKPRRTLNHGRSLYLVFSTLPTSAYKPTWRRPAAVFVCCEGVNGLAKTAAMRS